MTELRWKRRRHGWAGFLGTSRQATARVVRKPRSARTGVCQAYCRGHSWLRASSIGAAMRWCEQQLRPPMLKRPTIVALVVYPDGRTETRALERLQPALAIYEAPRLRPVLGPLAELEPASSMIHTVVCEGRWWQMSYEHWQAGINGTFRVMVYAHPAASPELVHNAAMHEIKRRRIMLDELLHKIHALRWLDGAAQRQVQQLADRIFEGEVAA